MTPLHPDDARRALDAQQFTELFLTQLGWDQLRGSLSVTVGDTTVALRPVAEKRGLTVWHCPAVDGTLPADADRRKISRQVRQSHHEHLLIFTTGPDEHQLWQWLKHRPGQAAQPRSLTWHPGTPGDLFLQQLGRLHVALEEEKDLGLIDVTGRVRDAFDVTTLTKNFYTLFAAQRDAFAERLTGFADKLLKSHYVSVIINRLMFIWFIQQKGFLDGDVDYLRTRFGESQADGPDRFYRQFLLPLFFEGFAVPVADRPAATRRLLGDIPYLSGSIFTPHPLEEAHGDAIAIADAAFADLFQFFASYTWHLDDRPVQSNDEINPEVLGYIFEKYINQKQMGAYYTQEDITGYITQNALLPWLLDAAARRCEVAFVGEATVWDWLAADPDRYLYPSLLHGVDAPLPEAIAAGRDDLTKRAQWNEPAPASHALPTEIWREVIARRERVADLRAKLAGGAVRSASDLITLNLNSRQFVEDILAGWDGPDLLDALWEALESVTVLDPTCGSGAFLFAVLNLLEPLYEACLDRMETFLPTSPAAHPTPRADRFRELLRRVDQHPNRAYFILKSIIVNNLYGVDLMPEAVEICHLRLFLKLIAAIDTPAQIEPLPDIGFNVQAGNTLVGYATQEEVDLAVAGQGGQMPLVLLPEDEATLAAIHQTAERAQQQSRAYRELQTTLDVDTTLFADARAALRETLKDLNDDLDRYLALQYDVDPDTAGYATWRDQHQPFHWFVEFYEIMKGGGFDVIVGNPPYKGYKPKEAGYRLKGYRTYGSPDLYAFTVERILALQHRDGRLGVIIPMSAFSTYDKEPLRDLLVKAYRALHVSYYSGDAHPSILFNGVKFRLAIVLGKATPPRDATGSIWTSPYLRWRAAARAELFDSVQYYQVDHHYMHPRGLWPKVGTTDAVTFLDRLRLIPATLGQHVVDESPHAIYVHGIGTHFIKCIDTLPYCWSENKGEFLSADWRRLHFKSAEEAAIGAALVNSNIFFLYYLFYSDVYHCGSQLLDTFPCDFNGIIAQSSESLRAAGAKYIEALTGTRVRRRIKYRTGWAEYDEYDPRPLKPLVDAIDEVLAAHYSYDASELDDLLNYDVKYRLGT